MAVPSVTARTGPINGLVTGGDLRGAGVGRPRLHDRTHLTNIDATRIVTLSVAWTGNAAVRMAFALLPTTSLTTHQSDARQEPSDG